MQKKRGTKSTDHEEIVNYELRSRILRKSRYYSKYKMADMLGTTRQNFDRVVKTKKKSSGEKLEDLLNNYLDSPEARTLSSTIDKLLDTVELDI